MTGKVNWQKDPKKLAQTKKAIRYAEESMRKNGQPSAVHSRKYDVNHRPRQPESEV